MFLFENDQNQKLIYQKPKIYLNTPPAMPDSFRLLLSGPTGSGKKTVANILHEKYGWKIVDWNKIMIRKIDELHARESH